MNQATIAQTGIYIGAGRLCENNRPALPPPPFRPADGTKGRLKMGGGNGLVISAF